MTQVWAAAIATCNRSPTYRSTQHLHWETMALLPPRESTHTLLLCYIICWSHFQVARGLKEHGKERGTAAPRFWAESPRASGTGFEPRALLHWAACLRYGLGDTRRRVYVLVLGGQYVGAFWTLWLLQAPSAARDSRWTLLLTGQELLFLNYFFN